MSRVNTERRENKLGSRGSSGRPTDQKGRGKQLIPIPPSPQLLRKTRKDQTIAQKAMKTKAKEIVRLGRMTEVKKKAKGKSERRMTRMRIQVTKLRKTKRRQTNPAPQRLRRPNSSRKANDGESLESPRFYRLWSPTCTRSSRVRPSWSWVALFTFSSLF